MVILKLLIPCLALSLGTGGLAGLIISKDIYFYSIIDRPFLSPPSWVFPVVWGILYVLMGFSHYLVMRERGEERREAIKFYYAQLCFNFLWPILFFRLKLLFAAAVCAVALLVLVIKTTSLFYKIKPLAGKLMAIYAAWTAFAAYLSIGSWLLN